MWLTAPTISPARSASRIALHFARSMVYEAGRIDDLDHRAGAHAVTGGIDRRREPESARRRRESGGSADSVGIRRPSAETVPATCLKSN